MKPIFRAVILSFLTLTMNGLLSAPAHGLTQREEIELVQNIARDVIKKQGPVLPVNSPAARRVARIGARLARLSSRRGIPFSYRVLNDTQVLNAFAAPGGPVFVTRRLLEWTRNDAELAAILGHETAHIEHRHIGQRIEKQEAARRKAGAIGEKYFGAARARAYQKFLRGATKVAFGVWSRGYGRENELAADATGTRWMSQLGYDPRAATRNLAHLRGGKQTATAERYSSTHPATEEREQRLHNQIKGENLLQLAQEIDGSRLNDVSTVATPPATDKPQTEPIIRPGALPPPVPTVTASAPAAPPASATPIPEPIIVTPPATPQPTRPAPTKTATPKVEVASPTITPAATPQATVAASPTPNGAPTPLQTAIAPVDAAPINAPPGATLVSETSAIAAKSAPSPWSWIFLGLGLVAVAAVGLVWQLGLWKPIGAPIIAASAPAQAVAQALNLKIQAANGQSWSVPLAMGARLIIGRDEDADLRLDDAQVSGQHAEIRRTPQGVWLVDLESTNGTFLSEKRIGSTLWPTGERARVGATILVVERCFRRLKPTAGQPLAGCPRGHRAKKINSVLLPITLDVSARTPSQRLPCRRF